MMFTKEIIRVEKNTCVKGNKVDFNADNEASTYKVCSIGHMVIFFFFSYNPG